MTSLYRLLMRLYPREHRARFQNEMLHVLAARAADARQKGLAERGLLAIHETTGLLLGSLRERQSMTPARRESPISSLRAPLAVLSLYTLCAWTIVDLGIHAMFSPISYAMLLGGILLGLWMVSSQRVLGPRRNRAGLIALTLFFWLGLPFGLSVSERHYRARLQEDPVEFSFRYPGGTVQATIANSELSATEAGWTASETIPLADDRSLSLVMRSANGAPPYRVLIPAVLMGFAFFWRRRHSRLAAAE
jgi:hypothetical protein